MLHEPPLFGLLAADPEVAELGRTTAQRIARAARAIQDGEVESGVRSFVDEVAFGPGTWAGVFDDELRRTCVANAETGSISRETPTAFGWSLRCSPNTRTPS